MNRLVIKTAIFSVLTFSSAAVAATGTGALISSVAKASGVSDAQAQKVMEALTATVSAELRAGRSVEIENLGTFNIATRNPKVLPGQQPKPAVSTVRFSAAAGLKSAVKR